MKYPGGAWRLMPCILETPIVQENSYFHGVYFGFYESGRPTVLNYRQLHYFWVVAKTGSITRASEQLNLTPQTISGQISLFEQTYGLELFQRAGRQLELTETGRQALVYAEQMFQIGGELEAMLRAGPQEQILFRVGVADVVPKSIVYRLLAPTMELDEVLRINCREDKLERLLADLAIQRLNTALPTLSFNRMPVPAQQGQQPAAAN